MLFDLYNQITRPKLIVEAKVIKRCDVCFAPGVDENNKYVGDTCPECGAKRPPIVDKGIIHSSSPLFRWKKRLNQFLGRE